MARNLKSLKRKADTAFNLLRHGEFQRFSMILATQVDKHLPMVPLPLLGSIKDQTFSPLATKKKQALTLRGKHSRPVVACILDEFSVTAWQEEFDLVELTPENWQKHLSNHEIDFLFCESAWRGKNEAWKGQLNQATKVSPALKEIVDHCKARSIPTAFWNKEDPPYFEDFKETALLFDYIFTTDSECIEKYQSAPGERAVHLLPFAAQPALHNPARNTPDIPGFPRDRINRGGVAFAGTYFAERFPERREQMDMILEAARQAANKSGELFTIFSRMGGVDKRYAFPQRLQVSVAGSLPYEKMLSAFQEHKIFLNVNTVTSSPTMCARRLFEIPACGSLVVTTPSKAIRKYFPADSIPIVSELGEATTVISSLLNSPLIRDKKIHKTQREIWRKHTYRHRAADILTALGIETGEGSENHDGYVTHRISVIASTKRPEQLPHLLAQVGRQANVEIELLLGTHGFKVSENELSELLAASGLSHDDVEIVELPEKYSLGACLNDLVTRSSMPLVTKMDDDDTYLPHYLEDLANALNFSGADLVGKQAVYVHLDSDELLLRNPNKEHIFTNFVIGPTLFGYRETFLNNPFEERTTGEDTAFLKKVIANGGKIYAADRFNFIQERVGQHTWNLSAEHFLSNGTVETWGLNEKHVLA